MLFKNKIFSVPFFRLLFWIAILLPQLQAYSKNPGEKNNRETFNDRSLKRKGVMLSQLLNTQTGKKDVHLKFSGAMRFEENYSPTDNKPVNLPLSEIQKHVKRAQDVLDEVTKSQAYTTLLQGKDIKLPIGIKKTVGNKDIVICLDSIIFTPTYAYGVLYVIIEDTRNNKKLAFWGKDVRFTKNGGFTGDARLELLQTYDLNFGSTTKISFLVDQTHQNYVVFDCNGFKQLHADARVYFSRSTFLPEMSNGKINPSGQVTADIMTDLQDFDNWLIQISNVPKFQVVGLEGLSFQVGTLAFDYSSIANPTGIAFPAGYTNSNLTVGNNNLWEGFYINNLTVTLPPEFKLKSKQNQRISLSIVNAIIDKQGFTGKAQVKNLLPLNDADMNGWDYSLDLLSVDIVKNTPVAASFTGSLVIPVTKQSEVFTYNANILPNNNYNFTVTNKTSLTFPLWGAGNVVLDPNSWVKITLSNGNFTPEASLNGKCDITATINGKNGDNTTTDQNSNLTLAQITFTKLLVKSNAPYLSIDPNGGAVSFGSPALQQKMAKLPVTISKVGIQSRNNGSQMGIQFTVLVNLVGQSECGGGFSGSADITVWGEQNSSKKWTYYKTELNKIVLNNIKIAVLTLSGYVQFYRDDQVYGSGFSGGISLNIELKGGDNLGLTAVCIFGKKDIAGSPDPYRYFAVDVLASVPAFPLFPGIVYLNAFGGGASYRMRMDNTVQNALYKSNSGVVYVPDNNKGLGLKALLGVQGQTRKAYEGQLILEIEFNAGGGLSQIAFSGYVQIASLGNFDQLVALKNSVGGFLNKIKASSGSTVMASNNPSGSDIYGEIQKMGSGGAVLAQWRMVYDRNNSSFTANIDVFVDIAGVIKGVNPNAHAGRIDILFTKSQWHVFVGQPNYPVGVSLIGLFNITSYFMVGQNLPAPNKMPVPGAPYPSFPTNASGQASLGKGFATGARLSISISGGGAFYYSAGVETGFDILIMDVSGQTCFGRPKGIKGWYGVGQAFLYVYGRAGFKKCVDIPYPCNCQACHSCSKKCWRPWCWGCDWCNSHECVDIGAGIDLGIYAYVEAPNPTYFEGSFSVLGFSVKVSGGKRC